FMKLIGQEEIWQNIQKGGAIGQAYTWFQGALSGLKAIVMGIPGIVISTITSLTWDDLIILPNAFIKVGKAFLNIAGQFTSWALGTTIDLLKILFSVVAPGVMPYIAKAGAAFNTILENPIGFVGNLVTAAKTGFQQFAANIGKHLKASLLNWLLVSLEGAGIYLPQELSFKEILKFVASVLGLTWENLRIKLVKHLGEPAVKALEAGFELIQILITEGPAAAWEKIMEHLSNLQSMIISEISQFVIVQVVQTAIAKLVTSLNPAGAVIQAIIAIYQTITFLIDKIQQIARVGAAIIDSIAAIANGVITAAANKVEQTLAGMLTLAVNFLAKFAGLGKISDAIINIVNKIRAPIDTAMDKIVEWIVAKGKSFLKKIVGAGTPENPQEKLEEGLSKAVSAVNKLKGNNIGKKLINPILAGIKVRYDFQVLTAEPKGKFWVIKGKVNPEGEKPTTIEVGVDEDKKVSFSVGEVISARYKNGMYVAIIVEVNDSTKMVGYDFVAQNGKFFKRFDVFEDAVKSGEVQKYVADKRGTFMGSNPSRNSSVGTAIKNRMKGEGTYKIEGNPPVELIEYPKGSGNWHPLDTCDLSHEPVDAVTWWNTIGYKFGPRSPKVKEFMTNPNNYIFEPLSSNRGRGSRSNEEYRLPEKV
ncbi:MAG: hypothetical protein KDC91_11140, partial [Flavobacteriaceae bacterium]|nr:hypothetical protein [Flavobacteriaceae bacterium]